MSSLCSALGGHRVTLGDESKDFARKRESPIIHRIKRLHVLCATRRKLTSVNCRGQIPILSPSLASIQCSSTLLMTVRMSPCRAQAHQQANLKGGKCDKKPKGDPWKQNDSLSVLYAHTKAWPIMRHQLPPFLCEGLFCDTARRHKKLSSKKSVCVGGGLKCALMESIQQHGPYITPTNP